MKVHVAARDASDLEALKVVADGIAAAARSRGFNHDYLIWSAPDDSFVNVTQLSRRVARRLGGPGLCESGRAALFREVISAVEAEAANGPSDGVFH